MTEHRSSAVKEPVGRKFDARLDDPAEGSIVVITDVGNEKGIIWSERGDVVGDRGGGKRGEEEGEDARDRRI